jgi:hypothetical protein
MPLQVGTRLGPYEILSPDAIESAPDGRRFAVHAALTDSRPNITVVLNWPLLLNQKK